MSTVPRVLVLTCLLLLVASAWGKRSTYTGLGHRRDHWGWPPSSGHSYPTNTFTWRKCLLDLKYDYTYRTKHPICSRLAANHAGSPFIPSKNLRCGWAQGLPQNITLHWDSDTSRAASALLAAQLRHLKNFQHVHLAPNRTLLSHRPNELVISLAAVVPNAEIGANYSGLKVYSPSHVPIRRRLHAWLMPNARSNSVCRHTNWSSHTDLNVLALCGFTDDWDNSYDMVIGVVDVYGVGEECKPTMQRLLQRAKAAGSPARANYVNRTVFEQEKITARYSFLFLDFDIWSGDPDVGVVDPPPCVSDSDSICEPELDNSTAVLVTENDILKENVELIDIEVNNFKPTPESLRVILDREANGLNIEEAACGWIDNNRNYSEIYSNPLKHTVLVIICVTDSEINVSYDSIIRVIERQIFTGSYHWSERLIFERYYTVCSDTSSRLTNVFDGSNIIGVVWVGMEGTIVASRTAAERRVPLLLAAPVPDVLASGDTTWWVGGRLRHIALALEHFVNMSGSTSVAVLSEPTTYAWHYLAAFEDANFNLHKFKLAPIVTQTVAKGVLRDLQATNTRVVFVNTNAYTIDLILAAAVELNMSYTDGFIWIVREQRKEEVECNTKYFTISFENVELVDTWKLRLGDAAGMKEKLPPYIVPLADALLTMSTGFKNVFLRHDNVLTDLRNDQVIREFDESLKEKQVVSFIGNQIIYKKRAIEEALVYVDSWCGVTNKPERVAEWRVNATSGSVRNASTSTFNNNVRVDGTGSDGGLNGTGGPGDVDSGSAGGLNGTGQPRDVDSGSAGGLNGTGSLGDVDSGSAGGLNGTSDLDSGNASDGIKSINTTDKPANTSNVVFWVHQWIESITKIETPVSGVSVFDLLNLKKSVQSSNTNLLNMTTLTH